MARFFKSLIAALLVLVPIIISETTDAFWKWHLISGFVVAVFLVDFFVLLKPDTRFETAREHALDYVLESRFSAIRNKLKKNERLPIRVTIQKPKLTIFGWRMVIVYSYEMKRTDPDYQIKFPKRHGLCWAVYLSGKFGWFEKSTLPKSNRFGLTPKEKELTDHLFGTLSLPLRHRDNEKPHAVMNFDALNDAAVDDLRNGKEDLINQKSDLVDLATYIGMFA